MNELALTKAEQIAAQQYENRRAFLPNAAEIAEKAKAIRNGWDENTELSRRAGPENCRIEFAFPVHHARRRSGIMDDEIIDRSEREPD